MMEQKRLVFAKAELQHYSMVAELVFELEMDDFLNRIHQSPHTRLFVHSKFDIHFKVIHSDLHSGLKWIHSVIGGRLYQPSEKKYLL